MPTATFSLSEPIGCAWRDELIWLPLSSVARVRVVNAVTGETQPSQISGSQVCVRVNLNPDEHLQLFLEAGASTSVPSPFTVDADQISNGVITARLPVTGAFDPGEASGPIVALQRDGKWMGQGVWGASAFTGRIETTITDRGPLFARWVVRYIIGGQVFACYECTLYAGEDFVHVRDETKLGANMAFRFRLTGGDAPTEWFTHGGGEAVTVSRGSITNPPSRRGLERPGEFAHIDFNSAHFQMSYTWMGFMRADAPVIGVGELHGGHWQIPGRNRIRLMHQDGGIEFVFPANGGSKEFALVCGSAETYAPATGLSQFCHLRRKYSDLPLEKVRHWVTDWPLRRYDRPILYPHGTAERWKEKLKAWPELAAAYESRDLEPLVGQLVTYLARSDSDRLTKILKKVDEELQKSVNHATQNGYLRLIIFSGRILKVMLEIMDVLRWRGELDEAFARSFARRAAFLAYCFADKDFWPWDSMFRDREDPRSLGDDYWSDMGGSLCPPNFTTEYYTSFGLVALAYPEHPMARTWVEQAADLFERNLEAYFYESGGYGESVNYHAHTLSMLTHLAVGLWAAGERDFFEHPRFKRTYGFFLDMLTPPSALTDKGVELATAPNMLNHPRDRKGVMITNWGNSGYDYSGYVVPITLAIAAGIYADRDPAYAQRLMTAWRLSAQEFCSHYLALHLLALGRPDLKTVPLNLESKLIEGLGAVMRADDVFGWVKCGTASNHNCYDEGGWVLYAGGVPIIGDVGYHAQHEGRAEGGSDTWKHVCVTFGGKQSVAYLGAEVRQPPELWHSTPASDLLICNLAVDYIHPDKAQYYLDIERIPRIEHRRQILFVKPHYFVIYDHISQTTLPPIWWLHALAAEVKIDGQAVRFIGRYGVDLAAQIVLPQSAQMTPGRFSIESHIRIDQAGAGEYLVVLAPLVKCSDAPKTEWNANQRLLRVEYNGRIDSIEVDPRMLRVL